MDAPEGNDTRRSGTGDGGPDRVHGRNAGRRHPAASVAWHIQKSPDATQPGGQIQSVSCSSAVSCTSDAGQFAATLVEAGD
jgi:hypothetical protein